MLPAEIAIAMIGAALILGFGLGFAVRAYISARRRKRWRYRWEQLPLHDSPFLAPSRTEPTRNQSKHDQLGSGGRG
jgi:hypothetical protein